jgi:hypothetical protein
VPFIVNRQFSIEGLGLGGGIPWRHPRFIKTTFARVGLLLAIASLSPAHAASSSIQRVRSAELAKMFTGDVRLRSLPIGQAPGGARREYFRADGSYEGCADLFARFGRYQLTADALCVTVRGQTSCRRFEKTHSGDLVERWIDGQGDASNAVEFSRPPKTEACNTVGVEP